MEETYLYTTHQNHHTTRPGKAEPHRQDSDYIFVGVNHVELPCLHLLALIAGFQHTITCPEERFNDWREKNAERHANASHHF